MNDRVQPPPRRHDFKLLGLIASSIAKLFSPYCEVVVHDFSDLEHSIVCMAGNITGRSVGGAATDLLLSRFTSGDTEENLDNYLTSLSQGRVMKSSTIFLKDEEGKTYGAFCINFDITPFSTFQDQLSHFLTTNERSDEITEFLSDDLRDTLQSLVTQTLREMGVNQPIMDRDTKVRLIHRLDERGIFQVNKAVPLLADLLNLSRATVYNYLRDARNLETDPTAVETLIING